MLTIEYKEEEGLIVKNNGQIIEGVESVKLDMNSNVYKEHPEITLTINPTAVNISASINDSKTQS